MTVTVYISWKSWVTELSVTFSFIGETTVLTPRESTIIVGCLIVRRWYSCSPARDRSKPPPHSPVKAYTPVGHIAVAWTIPPATLANCRSKQTKARDFAQVNTLKQMASEKEIVVTINLNAPTCAHNAHSWRATKNNSRPRKISEIRPNH